MSLLTPPLKRILSRLFIITLMLLSHGVAAKLKVFQLQQRPATEIIPLLSPHLDPDTAISGNGMQLIVSGSNQDIETVESLLQSLDAALKNYVLSIRFVNEDAKDFQQNDVDIELSNRGSSIRYSTMKQSNQQQQTVSSQIAATEGYPAYIATGTLVPIFLSQQQGNVTTSGTSFQPVINSGFYARVRSLSGDEVIVDISQTQSALESAGNQGARFQEAITQVKTQLGTWQTLGSVAKREGQKNQSTYSNQIEQRESTVIQIRVSEK